MVRVVITRRDGSQVEGKGNVLQSAFEAAMFRLPAQVENASAAIYVDGANVPADGLVWESDLETVRRVLTSPQDIGSLSH